jgi:PEP-CTERM motif
MYRKLMFMLFGVVGWCGPVGAASVTWGPPTAITGASDVSTVGTTYAAVNFGDTGAPAATVGGVTFQPLTVSGFNTSSITNGTVTLAETTTVIHGNNGPAGSNTGAFAAMADADYKTLLSSEINSVAIFTLRLTTSGLSVGQPYQVQLWCNYSSTANTNKVEITGGPMLDDNTTDAVGGLGQYVIGTFVADGPTQIIDMNGVQGTVFEDTEFGPITLPLINAFRIAAVPEPGTLGLVVFGAAGLLLRRRRGVH